MRIEHIPLCGTSIGTQRVVSALHFGDDAATRKIYIQTSLHADELPASLVAFYLRQKLIELENAGQLNAKIILVPLCNPIGLGQSVNYTATGRFDLFSGQNFNRLGAINLHQMTSAQLAASNTVLGSDELANKKAIRHAMFSALENHVGTTQVENLHLILLKLAYDADVVLDLHCDETATMHLYTLPDLWHVFEPLARFLQSECQLLADDSSANPFDEALSTAWAKLRAEHPNAAIPLGCATTTLELRGRADITHKFAQQDAQGIVQTIAHWGDIQLTEAQKMPQPELINPPNPLSGKAYVYAPESGVVVYHVKAGETVQKGQALADIVNPIAGTLLTVNSPIDGFIYARNNTQFTQQGENLVSVSGTVDLGKGAGLSA